jgi:cytochrome b
MTAASLLLWDPVVRLCHWSLAGAFVADYFFAEAGENWHRWFGYYAVAWLVIRLVWGFIGTPAARWADFWPTRARLAEHLRALFSGADYHRLGHSPLGALVMIGMLLLMLALGLSGFLMEEVDYFWGADLPLQIHAFCADALLALVGLHIAAALVESYRLKENLPLSMITGKRRRFKHSRGRAQR